MSAVASLRSSGTPASASNLFSPAKSKSRLRNPSHLLRLSTPRQHGFRLWVNETAQLSDLDSRVLSGINHGMMDDNHQSKSPQPKKPKFPAWFNWIFGWILSLILPLAHLKGGNLQRLGGPLSQAEKIVEVVEEVAEVADEVAEVVEKVSSEVAENVPDNTILKKTALLVEKASEQVEKNAKITMEFVEKVDEIKERVEEVVEGGFGGKA